MISAMLVLFALFLVLLFWVHRLDAAFHRHSARLLRAAHVGARLAARALADVSQEQVEQWDNDTKHVVALIIEFGKLPDDHGVIEKWLVQAKTRWPKEGN
jgi:hypothetical protein